MLTQSLTLPWGKESIALNLPGAWQIEGVLEPGTLAAVADPIAETRRSLSAPIGSPRLRELYRPGQRAALIFDDDSRPTPVSRLLPAVLEELESAGLRREDLTLVPALGLHRAMTAEQIARRIGFPNLDGMSWENPDCDRQECQVYLGATSRGTPVWVNRTVAGSDLVITLGIIKPHMIASFGGGYKGLIPGAAGRATIAHNHSLNCRPETFTMVGQDIARNPMRLDLEEAGRMLKPPVFIVNAVLDGLSQVVRVVCGDPVAAHREGVKTSAAIFGVSLPRAADVVISGSHPMDQDLRQGVTALGNTIRGVRPGGVHITLVRAEEGVGVFGLADRKLPVGRGAIQALAPLLLRVLPRVRLRGLGEEDRLFLYAALQSMRAAKLFMYAPTIPPAVQANLPFARFVRTIDQALESARRLAPERARVVIFPQGGTTYPVE